MKKQRLTRHSGDCTIYSSLINDRLIDGICTCGYGWERVRNDLTLDDMYSKEVLKTLRACRESKKKSGAMRTKIHKTSKTPITDEAEFSTYPYADKMVVPAEMARRFETHIYYLTKQLKQYERQTKTDSRKRLAGHRRKR